MESPNKYDKIVDSLIEMKDAIIPVLGEDICFISSKEGEQISLNEYLLNCFINEYGDKQITDEDKRVIIEGDYYGLSKLERFFSSDFEADYRRYIKFARKNGWIKIDETINNFLSTFKFPLIITTICFDYVEELITSLNYQATAYDPKGNNSHTINPITPTVYHIFGEISDGGSWVYDESKLLEFLHALHDKDTSAENIKEYIRNKNSRLLAIGCNLPDWLFRFLWYPLKNKEGDYKRRKGYWINSRNMPESFIDFLDNINFYSTQEVNNILSLAVDKYQREMQAVESDDSDVVYDGFISYASEDFTIAEKIFKLLTARGYKIWFDKAGKGKIEPGSEYMKKVAAGVGMAKHYIPIITGNFLTKVCNSGSNLKKELDIVKEHIKQLPALPDRYSIPIIIEHSIYNDESITSTLVEGMASYSLLPKPLFWQINMASFSSTDNGIDITL